MKNIANLLFEAKMLKEIPRSGYQFLGTGRESVAEHSFMTTFIAYVLSQMESDVDSKRLICMCLIHDLPEARIGDLNYVQKRYVEPSEHKALEDTIRDLPFESSMTDLIQDFNAGETKEAQLARDADQIAFILELKALSDLGYHPPRKWMPLVLKRIRTKTGQKLAASIQNTPWDEWWFKFYIDRTI